MLKNNSPPSPTRPPFFWGVHTLEQNESTNQGRANLLYCSNPHTHFFLSQTQLFGKGMGQTALRKAVCSQGSVYGPPGALQQHVDEIVDSWALCGLTAWSFNLGSSPAGLCSWSSGITFEFHTDIMAGQPLCQTFHRKACYRKVMKKILRSCEFMIKVQVLKALGSILGRKWKSDTFKKAKFKVLKLATVLKSQVLGVHFFLYFFRCGDD